MCLLAVFGSQGSQGIVVKLQHVYRTCTFLLKPKFQDVWYCTARVQTVHVHLLSFTNTRKMQIYLTLPWPVIGLKHAIGNIAQPLHWLGFLTYESLAICTVAITFTVRGFTATSSVLNVKGNLL